MSIDNTKALLSNNEISLNKYKNVRIVNNICQLACVVCTLPWEFYQPEESRDFALAREETFPEMR